MGCFLHPLNHAQHPTIHINMPEPSDIAEKELTASQLIEDLESEEKLEITIRKASNEIILRNPRDGKVVRLTGTFGSETDEPEDEGPHPVPPPLTPEAFEVGMRRLHAIGFTFDADLLPNVVARDDKVDINPEAFMELQSEFPQLPGEVGLVAHNTLTGNRHGLERLGGAASFEKKSSIVQEMLINDAYREQFFFRHALKLPSLELIDWEITMRMREKGVKGSVNVPYAVLQLSLRNKHHLTGARSDRSYSVAVSRELIDKHLAALSEARTALDKVFQAASGERKGGE